MLEYVFYLRDERNLPPGLVVLPAAVPCRASMGSGAGDGRLDAM